MTTLADVAAPPRARLVTRPLLVTFISIVGTATSFMPGGTRGASRQSTC